MLNAFNYGSLDPLSREPGETKHETNDINDGRRECVPMGMTHALTTTDRQQDNAFEAVTKLVLDSLTSQNSKDSYRIALRDFFVWFRETWRGSFTKAAVNAYKTELLLSGRSGATVNARLAAIRKLALEAADAHLLPNDVAAAVARVKCVRIEGTRTGKWLSLQQAQALLNAPDTTTLMGLRDRALMAILIGTGIRREEVCTLTFEHLQERDGRTVLLDLKGKGGRLRTVPVPTWTKQAVDSWAQGAGIKSGIVIRHTDRRLFWGRRLSTTCVWQIVQRNATAVGLGGLRPHDLRRTMAKLCRASGGQLEQIQLLLGHASIKTTEIYLGTKQDLVNSPNDAIRLGIVPRSVPPQSGGVPDAIRRVHGTGALAPGTLAAYRSSWRDFEKWCVEHELTALPAAVETVTLYIAEQRARLKPSTLEVRLIAISNVHIAAGYAPPASFCHAALSEAIGRSAK
jgi:integrase/recombinase XerD